MKTSSVQSLAIKDHTCHVTIIPQSMHPTRTNCCPGYVINITINEKTDSIRVYKKYIHFGLLKEPQKVVSFPIRLPCTLLPSVGWCILVSLVEGASEVHLSLAPKAA